MPYLIVSREGQELTRRELKRPVTVGRGDDVDLQVQDRLVSRKHCRFEPIGRGWEVVDLGSHNGTLIDGQRVQHHVLQNGQIIEIGDTHLTFMDEPFQSNRPASPQEAVLRARLEDEVESSADDTIGLSGRNLPQPKLEKAGRKPRRGNPNGIPAAFARPKPRPILPNPSSPSDPEPSSGPGLFARLLKKQRPERPGM